MTSGRTPVVDESTERPVKECIEKYRFVVAVRAPWVKKHLKLKCSLATVRRIVPTIAARGRMATRCYHENIIDHYEIISSDDPIQALK